MIPHSDAADHAVMPNYGTRLRIGMVLAAGNYCTEPDAQAILPTGVSLHTTRIALEGVDSQSLRGMLSEAERAAALLVRTRSDLIVFHCTAAATIEPDAGSAVAQRIHAATGIPATSTGDALVAALRQLNARKIVLLSPYEEDVNGAEVAFFRHHGIEVLREQSYPPAPGGRYPDATPQEWRERTVSMRHPDADAYFLSCTNIRCVSVVDTLESELGKPVITSNTATLWHALRMSGITDSIPGCGALLKGH